MKTQSESTVKRWPGRVQFNVTVDENTDQAVRLHCFQTKQTLSAFAERAMRDAIWKNGAAATRDMLR